MRKTSTTLATTEEALNKMREICLSLPDTREGEHFGEAAFYVKGKLFATCGEKHGVCEITFGLDPDHAAALVQAQGCSQAGDAGADDGDARGITFSHR